MTEDKKKKSGGKHLFRKVLQGLLIGAVAGAIAVLSGFFSFSRNLELMTLDLRYRLRPQIATIPEVGFLDYDDASLELFGEWPWPRMRQVALVKTLGFYNARMAGYDVFFLEKENTIFYPDRLKRYFTRPAGSPTSAPAAGSPAVSGKLLDDSFRNYDREFADAIKRSNRIYLAYFAADPDEKIASKGLTGILAETDRARKKFSALKNLSTGELEKTFLHVPEGIDKYLYKTTDLDAPLPELTRSAKGVGFAQPGIDEDSVSRNYTFFRYYNKQMLYSITLKMLSDILDFKLSEVEIYPGEYMALKNALDYKTKQRKDIKIPIDGHCQILLNTAGAFHDTFFHVPFRTISYYYAYNTAKGIARQHTTTIPTGAAFSTLKDHIYSVIMEEGMVTKEEAGRISGEVAAASVISRTGSGRGPADSAEVFRKIKGGMDRAGFDRVYSVVSAAMDMETALKSGPALTFEQWQKAGGATAGSLRQTPLSEGHLREVFRNVKFFSGKGRLDEVRPLYFPPVTKILVNGGQGDFSPIDLEGKIFMIGLTGTGTIDSKPIPFEEECPLVALHVNAINTVLTQNFLSYPSKNYKYAVTILFSLLIGVVGVLFSIPVSFFLTLSAAGGYLYATYKLWVLKGLWLDWVVPVFGIIFSYMTIIVMQYIKEFREKKKVRGIFATMVSPAVLKVMEENPDKFSLTGERKPATTLFSMINGIGNITKTVAPDELASLLSIYLTPNSEIIMDYDGYIDKYEGHVIMADFGVPLDDESNPWKCAFSTIEQRIDIESFKHFVMAKYGMRIGVFMGFNYGYVSAGNMGSERKFQYTVMGDPVNVSARFMASNFIYNSVYSITGEDTVPVIRDYVHLRPLDRVLLKGKTKPTAIFNVTGWKPDAYMELRGNRPVPDFLDLLWTKCPAEKIFGYHRMWSRIHARTGHPLAGSIQKFFGNNLDTANLLLLNSWKKEIAGYCRSIEELRSDMKQYLDVTVDFPAAGDVRDFGRVLDEWTAGLHKALEVFNESEEKARTDKVVEAFLEQGPHSAQLLVNKIGMLIYRLNEDIPAHAIDPRINASMQEIKEFIPHAHEAQTEAFEGLITVNSKNYKNAAGAFCKSIRDKKQEYHEMMSIVGSPTDEELAADRCFEEGLAFYWDRQWDVALEKFRDAVKLTIDKSTVFSLIERIEGYKLNPPGEKWQGEFVQTKK